MAGRLKDLFCSLKFLWKGAVMSWMKSDQPILKKAACARYGNRRRDAARWVQSAVISTSFQCVRQVPMRAREMAMKPNYMTKIFTLGVAAGIVLALFTPTSQAAAKADNSA